MAVRVLPAFHFVTELIKIYDSKHSKKEYSDRKKNNKLDRVKSRRRNNGFNNKRKADISKFRRSKNKGNRRTAA